MRTIKISDILKELSENDNGFGEPQAWIELSDGRSVEITEERDMLPKDAYYYSIRLHCSNDEFDNDDFHGTCGVVESLNSSDKNIEELQRLLNNLLIVYKYEVRVI